MRFFSRKAVGLFFAAIYCAVAVSRFAFVSPALADTEQGTPDGWKPSPVTPGCILQAAKMQNIPPHIILGLLKTEGGHLGSESPNKDGSVDLGPMQINDKTWVPILARAHFGGNRRLAYIMLRDHGCYSIYIGAWIFRQYLDEARGNYADAVGYYNSHNERQKNAYEKRFAANFKELFGWMVTSQQPQQTR